MADSSKRTKGRYELNYDQKCAREGCTRASQGDDYCSRKCVELVSGVRTKEQDEANRKITRRIRRQEDEPTVVVDNPHVNRPRHEGPQTRKGIRMTSGR